MMKLKRIVFVGFLIVSWGSLALAANATDSEIEFQSNQALVTTMTETHLSRRIDQLERLVSNLDRKIGRLDDKVDRHHR